MKTTRSLEGDMKMKTTYWIAMVLVIVGAVNWGLVGLFGFDLVATLFGPASVLSRVVYSLVGAAGLALAGIAATTIGSRGDSGVTMPAR